MRLAVTAAPWRSAAYLLVSTVIGTVLFTLVVTVVAVSAPLVVIGIGLPLLLAAAHVIRGAAHLERQRAAMVPGVEVAEPPAEPADHADNDGVPPADRSLFAALRRRWTDPAMAPSLGYLVGLYVPLMVLDTVAVGLWFGILGGVTIPFWYWAVPQTFDGVTDHGLFWGSFPHGPGGPDAVGLAIDDLPTAIAVGSVFAVLFVAVACPLVVAAARLHARTAGRLLGRPADPLAQARAVLRTPGPLAPLAGTLPGRASPPAPPHRLTLAPPVT